PRRGGRWAQGSHYREEPMARRLRGKRLGVAAAAVLASAALLGGCASNGGSGSDGSGGDAAAVTSAGVIGDQADPGEPVSGGTLSFAGYSMPSSLDPTKTQPAGSTGGTEMASIYGLLVR